MMIINGNCKKIIIFILCMVLAIACFVGCSSNAQSYTKVLSYDDFITELSKSGLEVNDKIQPVDSIGASFFSVNPKIVSIYLGDNKEEVFVYNFSDKKITNTQAQKVSSNGSKIGELYIEGDRHFYKHGNMIIAYFGSSKTIKDNLEKIVGKPFASSNL